MRGSIPARRRLTILVAAFAVALLVGGITHGWSSVAYVIPVPVLVIVGFYVWGSRDSEIGALVRHQLDERQVVQQWRVQALVGRVLSVGVVVGYVIAAATKATLWPWAALLGLMAVALVAGWFMHGEFSRGDDSENLHTPH